MYNKHGPCGWLLGEITVAGQHRIIHNSRPTMYATKVVQQQTTAQHGTASTCSVLPTLVGSGRTQPPLGFSDHRSAVSATTGSTMKLKVKTIQKLKTIKLPLKLFVKKISF